MINKIIFIITEASCKTYNFFSIRINEHGTLRTLNSITLNNDQWPLTDDDDVTIRSMTSDGAALDDIQHKAPPYYS